MRHFIILFLLFTGIAVYAQQYKSIHQIESEYYNSFGFTNDSQWDSLFNFKSIPSVKSTQACPLNKIVFGWNPYWQSTQYTNFQWEQLSDLCWFSYEFSTSTGNPTNTHSWSTAAAVTAALNNGKRVHLCVTMFSDHATFFGSSTAQNTLISNLIAALQQRNAHGINIDFESVPSAQKDNMTAFMKNLSHQVHTAIPGSLISICVPAVDWSGTFDVINMTNDATSTKNIDWITIMGYDYYWDGSSQAGPCDPLYSLTTGYNYNLTKTLTYYLNKIPASKIILGLPYYGKDWPTESSTVVSNTTDDAVSRTYKYVRDNASTFGTKLWNNTTYTPYYTYQVSTQWHQCWIADAYAYSRRLDLVNQRGVAGIGIWALGYDDGYSDMWNTIKNKFSSCATVNCSDTIYDMGGPDRNYYDYENYTYTIQPTGATGLSLNFSSFDVEANYDTLWLYDGANISAPLIGSYTGTNSPGQVNATGSAITLRFKSDNATNNTGWMAIWQCSVDNVPPVTAITAPTDWVTDDFTASFTDTDNGTVEKSYYQVLDYDGQYWGANANRGFFGDNFDVLNTSVWSVPASSGTWSVVSGNLYQSDSTVNNTNIYAALNQNLSNRYLYHFTARLESQAYSTNQRRYGFHFHCDTGNVPQRGNSYFVFFRQELSRLEFYKVTNSNAVQTKIIENVSIVVGQWYDIKVIHDRVTGKIDVYRDDDFIGTWTDPAPHATPGDYVSFRTGHSKVSFGELKVYRSRYPSLTISIGNASADIRYQNPNPTTHGAKIKSICNDAVGNLSAIAYHDLNIDWTAPNAVSVNDGAGSDADETYDNTTLSANWTNATDVNSGLAEYFYAIGSSYGGTDIIGWTSNGLNTTATVNGLNLTYGEIYYISVKSLNNAGLESPVSISDGITVMQQAVTPVADFTYSSEFLCDGDSILFINNSQYADSYKWYFESVVNDSSVAANPVLYPAVSGNYNVTLIANGMGGSDTVSQNIDIVVTPEVSSLFSVNNDSGQVPFTALFTNNSVNATSYQWNFGDGSTSSGMNPYHIYSDTGYFSVSLIASNSCGTDTFVFDSLYVYDLTGINSLSFTEGLIVYPNPAADNITIELTLSSAGQFQLYFENILSQKISVYSGELTSGKHRFNVGIESKNISAGAYNLVLENQEQEKKVVRVMIEK